MALEINPSNRIHTDTEVKLSETTLEPTDKLVVITDSHLSEVDAYLEEVIEKVREFNTKLSNSISFDEFGVLKEKLGDISILGTGENIVSVLTELRSSIVTKANNTDIEELRTLLSTKANEDEIERIENRIGNSVINSFLPNNVIDSINSLLGLINQANNNFDNYLALSGGSLTGKVSYEENVNTFNNKDIPHAEWVENKITDKVGDLESTGLSLTNKVSDCLNALKSNLESLNILIEDTISKVGDLTSTSIPEEYTDTVSSSLRYLNSKVEENKSDIERQSTILESKADKASLDVLNEELKLVKGAKVIVSILTETKDEVEALENKQEFLSNKVKESGRKQVRSGYEVRTSDGYSYYYHEGNWYLIDKQEIVDATETTSGLIKYKNEKGFVNSSSLGDGTATIVGFDELSNDVAVLKTVSDEKLDKSQYRMDSRERNAQLKEISKLIEANSTKLESVTELSSEAKEIALRADNLSKENKDDITTIKNEMITLSNDNSRALRNASTALTVADEAKAASLVSGEKAKECERHASNAKASAAETKLYANRMLTAIGDLSGTGLNNTISVADSLKEVNSKVIKLTSALENNNNNTVTLFNNGTKLEQTSFETLTSVFGKPSLVVDKRGYFHLFSEYREDNNEISKSDILYSTSKDCFKTFITYIFKQRILGKDNASEDFSRLKLPTAVYNKNSDKIVVLTGAFLDNANNWTEVQSDNWKYSILSIGTWNSLTNGFDWEHKTIGNSSDCDIVIANLPAECKGLMGIGSIGVYDENTNEVIIGVQYTTHNNDVITGVIKSNDLQNWNYLGDPIILKGLSDGALYRSLLDNSLVLLNKSVNSYGLKARTSTDGIVWSSYSALNDKLAGLNRSSQISTLNIESGSGRKYTIAVSTNYVNDYPNSKNRQQNELTLFLVSEKSQTIIPVDTLYVTDGGNYSSSISYKRDGNGDKLIIAIETNKGLKIVDATRHIPKIEMLHDKYDDSLAGLTYKQKQEVATLSGGSASVDALTQRIDDLEKVDTEIRTSINNVKKMLEGAVKGMRFVGICTYTKDQVEANKQLLTAFVNARFTDPTERLRTGDIVSTVDKYTYVYLRNELGGNDWINYNEDGDLADILNRLDSLERNKTQIETELLELKNFKTQQEGYNSTNDTNLSDIRDDITAVSDKIGTLTGTGLGSSSSVTDMFRELKSDTNAFTASLNAMNSLFGNLQGTGLTNTDTIADSLKELNDKVNNASNVTSITNRLDSLEQEDLELNTKIENIKKMISDSINGIRFVGIINNTKDEVSRDTSLLTNFVNNRFTEPSNGLKLGDIVATKDMFTYIYLRGDSGDEWTLFTDSSDLGPIITRLESIEENITNAKRDILANSNNNTSLGNRVSALEAEDVRIMEKYAELAEKIQDNEESIFRTNTRIGDISTTSFNNKTSVTEILKEIKSILDNLNTNNGNVDGKIGDLSTTGLTNTSSVSEGLKELKDETVRIEGITTDIKSSITDLQNNKLSRSDLSQIEESIEILQGAHVVVAILTETKDEIEGQVDKNNYLDQKVIESGKNSSVDGYELRTSDGYGYFRFKGSWYLTKNQQLGAATTTSLGLIKFKDEDGYISRGDGDGTSKVVGFDVLKQQVIEVDNKVDGKLDSSVYNTEKQDIKTSISDIKSSISNITYNITNIDTKIDEQIANITASIEGVKGESETQAETIQNVNDRIGDIEATGFVATDNVGNILKEVKGCFDGKDTEIEEIRNTIGSIESTGLTGTDIGSQLTDANTRLTSLENSNTSEGEKLTNIENELNTLKSSLESGLQSKANVGDSYAKSETYSADEVNEKIREAVVATNVDTTQYYTKNELDPMIGSKANVDEVYSKTDVDDMMLQKADSATVYSKDETDLMLEAYSKKTDLDDYYNKTQVESLLGDKADNTSLASVNDEVTLIKESLDNKVNVGDLYSKEEVDTKIQNIDTKIDSVPQFDSGNYYSKPEVDNLLTDKVDNSTLGSYYNKDEMGVLLDAKADTVDTQTKLDLKLDASVYESKIQDIEAELSGKLIPSDLAALTQKVDGLETIVSTLPDSTDLERYAEKDNVYNKTDVDGFISTLATKEEVNLKADATAVDSINTKIQTIETSLDSKLEADSLTTIESDIQTIKSDLSGKADSANVYTKEEVDSAISSATPNIDLSGYYNKTEVDGLLVSKVNSEQIEVITNAIDKNSENIELNKQNATSELSRLDRELVDVKEQISNLSNNSSQGDKIGDLSTTGLINISTVASCLIEILNKIDTMRENIESAIGKLPVGYITDYPFARATTASVEPSKGTTPMTWVNKSGLTVVPFKVNKNDSALMVASNSSRTIDDVPSIPLSEFKTTNTLSIAMVVNVKDKNTYQSLCGINREDGKGMIDILPWYNSGVYLYYNTNMDNLSNYSSKLDNANIDYGKDSLVIITITNDYIKVTYNAGTENERVNKLLSSGSTESDFLTAAGKFYIGACKNYGSNTIDCMVNRVEIWDKDLSANDKQLVLSRAKGSINTDTSLTLPDQTFNTSTFDYDANEWRNVDYASDNLKFTWTKSTDDAPLGYNGYVNKARVSNANVKDAECVVASGYSGRKDYLPQLDLSTYIANNIIGKKDGITIHINSTPKQNGSYGSLFSLTNKTSGASDVVSLTNYASGSSKQVYIYYLTDTETNSNTNQYFSNAILADDTYNDVFLTITKDTIIVYRNIKGENVTIDVIKNTNITEDKNLLTVVQNLILSSSTYRSSSSYVTANYIRELNIYNDVLSKQEVLDIVNSKTPALTVAASSIDKPVQGRLVEFRNITDDDISNRTWTSKDGLMKFNWSSYSQSGRYEISKIDDSERPNVLSVTTSSWYGTDGSSSRAPVLDISKYSDKEVLTFILGFKTLAGSGETMGFSIVDSSNSIVYDIHPCSSTAYDMYKNSNCIYSGGSAKYQYFTEDLPSDVWNTVTVTLKGNKITVRYNMLSSTGGAYTEVIREITDSSGNTLPSICSKLVLGTSPSYNSSTSTNIFDFVEIWDTELTEEQIATLKSGNRLNDIVVDNSYKPAPALVESPIINKSIYSSGSVSKFLHLPELFEMSGSDCIGWKDKLLQTRKFTWETPLRNYEETTKVDLGNNVCNIRVRSVGEVSNKLPSIDLSNVFGDLATRTQFTIYMEFKPNLLTTEDSYTFGLLDIMDSSNNSVFNISYVGNKNYGYTKVNRKSNIVDGAYACEVINKRFENLDKNRYDNIAIAFNNGNVSIGYNLGTDNPVYKTFTTDSLDSIIKFMSKVYLGLDASRNDRLSDVLFRNVTIYDNALTEGELKKFNTSNCTNKDSDSILAESNSTPPSGDSTVSGPSTNPGEDIVSPEPDTDGTIEVIPSGSNPLDTSLPGYDLSSDLDTSITKIAPAINGKNISDSPVEISDSNSLTEPTSRVVTGEWSDGDLTLTYNVTSEDNVSGTSTVRLISSGTVDRKEFSKMVS